MIDFKARQMASKALEDASQVIEVAQKVSDIQTIQEKTFEPTGFALPQDLTHNTTTYVNLDFDIENRIFSISPVGDSYDIYSNGKLYTKTSAETVEISNTDGIHFIYFDYDGVLKESESFNFIEDGHVAVSYIYWNSSEQKYIGLGLETHGSVMDWATHLHMHEIDGAEYVRGLLAGNYTLVGDGSSDNDVKISISNGMLVDEDIRFFIEHSDSPSSFGEQVLSPVAKIPVVYRDGEGGIWNIDTATDFPLKQGTSRIAYNLNTAGTWTTPDVTNNDEYMAMWIMGRIAKDPIFAVLGQRIDVSLENAKANNTYGSLNLGDFVGTEIKPLWRLIYKTNSTYANTAKAILVDIETLLNVSGIQISAGLSVEHNSLIGRNATGAHPASAVSFNNVSSGYISENIQEVIDEVIDNKLELSGGQLTGIVKDASFIEFPNDGNPLISHLPTVAHTITHLWSSGKVHGFELTDNGNGTINLDSGDIFLRDLDTLAPLGNLKEYHIAQTANIDLTDNSVNYICANYNGGVPEICVMTDLTQISGRMMVALYIVTRIGTRLFHYDIGSYSTDFDIKYGKKIVSQKNFEYGGNGAKITEVDNRKLNITESAFYYINERLTTPSFNTSTSDSFKYLYRGINNSWNRVSTQTTLSNSQYDDGSGTLVSIPTGKYVVNWVYLVLNTPTELYVKYPTEYHDTVASAKVESIPLVVPPELQPYSTGILIGKIILQEGNSNIVEINDPFTQQFWTTSPTSHNELYGLNTGNYQHLTPAQITTFNGKATKVSGAINGNFAGLDASGELTDSGKKDSDYVHLAGNETIAGTKTFSTIPIIPVTAPTLDTEISNKKYVDDGLALQEKLTNKATVLTTSNDTLYPTVKAVNTALALKEPTFTKGNLTAGSTKITISGTGTGSVIGAGVSVDVNEANLTHNNIGGTLSIAKGGTNSTAALNNNRLMVSSGDKIVESTAITASKALASDTNGIPVATSVTTTELGYVSGVTSAIQTQINGKQASLGFTAENVANKSTAITLGTSDTLYPTQNAVKAYVDTGLGTKESTISKGNLTGTNVSVTGGAGAVIGSGVAISIPQSVATTATPTFTSVTTTAHFNVSIGTTTITNGTLNDVVVPDTDVVFITASTGNATITGIAGGYSGRMLRIVYTGGNNITFSNQNSGSVATNRFTTLGSNFVTNGAGSVNFVHDGTGWFLLGGVA